VRCRSADVERVCAPVRAMRARAYENRHAFPFAAADLPMSAVNCCLIFVEGSTDKAVRVCRQPRAWALLRPPLNAHAVLFC
jgi:hypothetical protein